jgi:AcrR family transcriptional regulator
MTVEGLRDRKKNETRQALRDAAHRLFAEKGFSQTTIDDIAEAADASCAATSPTCSR